ncbi:transposable element Tc1 transposase [Trichonephila clavipes]|nr:transposable element Tc1 transposase [Trichonephila clavipes]
MSSRLVLRLPILKAWNRHRLNREVAEKNQPLKRKKVLENLMTFLRHEVEGEEHRVLAENVFGSSTNRARTESKKLVQEDEPTTTTLVVNTHAGKMSCVCVYFVTIPSFKPGLSKNVKQELRRPKIRGYSSDMLPCLP